LTRRIALYGKGGIGKSTIASNVAAASALEGYRVVLIGCDPKCDCSVSLMHGNRIPTVLDTIREKGTLREEDVVKDAPSSVRCVEVGGPEPGVGCAGRGIIVALSELEKVSNVCENADLIIYDVLGDIVCGGFAAPIRRGYVDEVYVVTSGEYMPLFAANNICKALRTLEAGLGGVICNSRLIDVDRERKMVEAFSRRLASKSVAFIPKDDIVQSCEVTSKTVVEMFPRSTIAQTYAKLARRVLDGGDAVVPTPLTDEELRNILRSR